MKKNLITALKKLLTAFGGDAEQTKDNAVDIVDKIADNVSGGGSGGILNISIVEVSKNHIRLDKTWREIFDAMSAGKMCVVFQKYGTDNIAYDIVSHCWYQSNYYPIPDTYNVLLTLLSPPEFTTIEFIAHHEDDYPEYEISDNAQPTG